MEHYQIGKLLHDPVEATYTDKKEVETKVVPKLKPPNTEATSPYRQ